MKKSAVALIVLVVAASLLFTLDSPRVHQFHQKSAFETWKIKFAKNYGSMFQENYRFMIFKSNLFLINEHNAKYQSGEVFSTLRLNHFSDLANEEFKNNYLSEFFFKDSNDDFSCKGQQYPKNSTFQQHYNSSIGFLTPVQVQHQCGSGYAFATAAGVEASMYKTIRLKATLSAQQLIDCSEQTGNNGCQGGSAFNALHYLINKGAIKESDYPYTGRTDECKYSSSKKIWEVWQCTKVDSNLEMLKSQIIGQPVIVGFDASETTFIFHGTGLYVPKKCDTKINHYMLAVGWGQETTGVTDKTINYYILVKNSFGTSWGDSGYAKIVVKKGKTPNNACGMLTDMHFPFV